MSSRQQASSLAPCLQPVLLAAPRAAPPTVRPGRRRHLHAVSAHERRLDAALTLRMGSGMQPA